MPKLVASFARTAAAAVIHAAATSAAWVANAVKTSVVWVVTELPKIIAGFAVTSASAVVHAATSSAAWIASATASAVAWVVTQLPRIIAGFAAVAASAVAQAAVASAAWVGAAVTSSASWEAFGALVATPLVMPAIAVGAALGAIALVARAVQDVVDAWNAWNNTLSAAAADAQGQTAAEQSVINSYKSGKISKADEVRILQFMAQPQHALGTQFAGTNAFIAGENGPELVTGAKGAKVYNNRDTKAMLSGAGKTVHIENFNVNSNVDVSAVIRKIGFRLATA